MEMTIEQLKALVGEIVSKAQEEAANVPEANKKDPIADSLVRKDFANDLLAISPEERQLAIARVVRALAAGKGDGRAAHEYAARVWGDGEASASQKMLVIGTNASGGYLIPEIFSDDFIELYRPFSTIRRIGATEVPMPEGNLTFNGLATGASAGYIGEAENLPVSTETFRQMKLSAKKLGVLVPISNDLLRCPSGKVDVLVKDDLGYSHAHKEDVAMFRSDGTANEPVGLKSLCLAGNTVVSSGTTYANIRTDLVTLRLKLREADVPFRKPCWVFAPRTETALLMAENSAGLTPLGDEMMTHKTLLGFPYFVTTIIPVNLGAGTDESEVYLMDASDVVIGDQAQTEIAVSNEASYYDGTNMRSAFHADLTLMRAISKHDINMRHLESLAMLTSVKWSI